MPPESRIFEVVERESAKKQLEPGQSHEFVFDVTNTDSGARNAGVDLSFEEGCAEEQKQWFAVHGPEGADTERVAFGPKQTRAFKLKVTVPPDADTKDYKARLLVWDVELKNEVYTEGNWVTTEVRKEPVVVNGRSLLWLWITLGVVGVAAIGALVWFLVFSGGVKVPELVGDQLIVAEKRLGDLEFDHEVIFEVQGAAPETVLDQDPPGGKKAKKGSTITLTVEEGYLSMPDVVDMDLAAARSKLEGAGFTAIETEEVVTGKAPNTVVEQDPPPEFQQSKANPVVLRVEAPLVAVPNFVNMTIQQANESRPAEMQLVVVRDELQGRPEGTVLSHSPTAGTSVRKNATISLVVERASVPVPPVENRPLEEARQILISALGAKIQTKQKMTNASNANKVLSQNPAAGQRVSFGSTVTLEIGVETVNLPDVKGQPYVTAKNTLRRLGLKVLKTAVREGKPGQIVGQDPGPKAVAKGSKVKLTVAEPKHYVDLVGLVPPASDKVLNFGQPVNFTFTYKTDQNVDVLLQGLSRGKPVNGFVTKKVSCSSRPSQKSGVFTVNNFVITGQLAKTMVNVSNQAVRKNLGNKFVAKRDVEMLETRGTATSLDALRVKMLSKSGKVLFQTDVPVTYKFQSKGLHVFKAVRFKQK